MRMTQLQRKNPGSLKGFTLIEVMVTVLIFAILAGAINMVLLVGQSSWHANRVQIEILQELRKAMSLMEDELRETAQQKITAGPTVADGSASTSITFYAATGASGGAITWNANTTQYFLGEDLNGNGSLDAGEDINGNGTLEVPEDADLDGILDTGEDINGDGRLNGAPILRIEGSETRVIAQNISRLEFSRTLATANIIDVTLAALKETTDGRVLTIEFSFSVRMRN